MRLNNKTGGILVMALLVCISSIEGFSEFSIATDTSDQHDPAIYSNTVVWADYRNGNEDIYGYNLYTDQEFQITTDEKKQWYPVIYEDIVIWYDNRNGNDDIYGYNLTTNQEFPITTDPNNQYNPAIYEKTVVWADYRNGNWDIYGYDLLAEEEFQITTDLNDQYDPAIYGDIVVWTDTRNENWDIYGYNLLTKEEFQITTNTNIQSNPAIYGNIVVWKDNRTDNYDIYGYNLLTEEEFPLTANESDQESPAIYGDTIVWKDYRNGNWDIYGYRLSIEEEFQITTDPGDQSEPAVHENLVVWEDNRNGNLDIYGYDLLTKFPLIILVDRGYSGEYFVGDMLTVQWIASKGGTVTFSLKDADGSILADLGSAASGSGRGHSGWTLKEEYGYGKKLIYAETNTSHGGYSAECEFYIVKKVADIVVKTEDQDGEPISGADVLLDNTFEVSTDSSGVCTIREVEFGEHTITAEFEGREESKRIQVTSTKTQYINFVFDIEKIGSIYIRVFDRNNEPIKNAEIYIDGSKKGYTSEEGVFEAPVPEGGHLVEARWQNETEDKQVEVKREETTFVDLIIYTPPPVSPSFPYEILAIIVVIVVVVALLIGTRIRRKKEEEKKEEEKPHVLICPQCKNRIQEDWDTCPYCKIKLK